MGMASEFLLSPIQKHSSQVKSNNSCPVTGSVVGGEEAGGGRHPTSFCTVTDKCDPRSVKGCERPGKHGNCTVFYRTDYHPGAGSGTISINDEVHALHPPHAQLMKFKYHNHFSRSTKFTHDKFISVARI
jgi:hypothetical protein